jgi:signal transduction histidine kinase
LDLEVPEVPIGIDGDATQLSIVVRALCDNALAAVDRGGHIHVTIRKERATSGASPTVAISVIDDGQGINDEVRQHIFDPFYSGRQAGRGLGMGLAKAWRIVQNHHGRIDVASGPAKGATFTVVLPVGA